MSRMLETIKPKADQLNADDMIGVNSDLIIKITRVDFTGGDQPVSIHYEGCNGRPWKPCLSMRRVLVDVWGGEENYPGRSVSLYRDNRVSFGDQREIGGIRIRAMSDIDGEKVIPLTATRGKKVKYTVRRLILQGPSDTPAAIDPATAIAQARTVAAKGSEAFRAWWSANPDLRAAVKPVMDEMKAIAAHADAPPLDEDRDEFGLPKLADDPITDRPTTATDTELSAQITREQAELDRAERDFMAARERGEA